MKTVCVAWIAVLGFVDAIIYILVFHFEFGFWFCFFLFCAHCDSQEAMALLGKAGHKKARFGHDLHGIFEKFDKDDSGGLDFNEFQQALSDLGAHLTPEQQDAVFKHFDPNGEGKIDYGEFTWAFYNRRRLIAAWKDAPGEEGCSEAVKEQSKLTRMKELFHRFDSQRKGKLKEYQFKKVMEGLGIDLADWEFKAMLKRFDSDSDGYVDYKEFVRFMEEQVGHKLNERASGGGGANSERGRGQSARKSSRPVSAGVRREPREQQHIRVTSVESATSSVAEVAGDDSGGGKKHWAFDENGRRYLASSKGPQAYNSHVEVNLMLTLTITFNPST